MLQSNKSKSPTSLAYSYWVRFLIGLPTPTHGLLIVNSHGIPARVIVLKHKCEYVTLLLKTNGFPMASYHIQNKILTPYYGLQDLT